MIIFTCENHKVMKTIYIIRHAKSSWDEKDLPDETRPLVEKGRKRTERVINYLVKHQLNVDLIIASHAVRAFETAKILAHGLNYPIENIKINPHLYFTDCDGILSLFYEMPDIIDSVMIVGHNPAMTDFANLFLDKSLENLPTSGVVSISFDTGNWNELPLAKRTLNFTLFPKEL